MFLKWKNKANREDWAESDLFWKLIVFQLESAIAAKAVKSAVIKIVRISHVESIHDELSDTIFTDKYLEKNYQQANQTK